MANELGTWGVVLDPYQLPERGPEFDIGQCGCISSGVGAPDNAAGFDNDLYVNSSDNVMYQKRGGIWVIASP